MHSTQRVDARAWVLWLASSLSILFLVDHPATDVSVILAGGLIAAAAKESSPFRSLLLLGIVFLTVRTVLFGLTGHTGQTILFDVPAVHLPPLLGGATLGGPVTAEVLASSVAEGVRIVAVMACFGAFLTVVEVADLVRLLPRFLFEAGLVTSIAMAFAPQLARSASQIREAQTMRGGRRRLSPTFVPLLANALDRSISLAESMDSRGYGRAESSIDGRRFWQRVAAASALLLAGSGSLWMMRRDSLVAGAATFVVAAILAWSLSHLNRLVKRTRYRRQRFGHLERSISAAAGFAVLAALALSQAGWIERFEPYRALSLIAPHPLAPIIAAAAALPAIIASRRRAG